MNRTPKELLAEAAARRPGTYLEMTVRELLAHWECRYRDFDTVARIEADLEEAGLTTEPPFASGPASTTVRLVPVDVVEAERPDGKPSDTGASEEASPGDTAEDGLLRDDVGEAFPQVSLRVGDLPSATGGVTSVSPDGSLVWAQTLMMRHGYSQLPVLADPRTLRGAVSWESITCARIAKHDVTLSDATDPHPEVVHSDDDLLDKLPRIVGAGFAFVRGTDDRICGVVTTADLSNQFDRLAGPFFLIGEIERRLHRRIDQRLSPDDLRAVGGRKVRCADDLMLGKCVELLRDGERWTRLGWRVDGKIFVDDLDEVRKIRNAVMHFDAEPFTDGQLEHLRRFRDWLHRLDPQP